MFHCKPYLIAFAFSFFVGLPLFSIFQAMKKTNMNHASIVAVVGSKQNFSPHLSKQKQKQ